MNAIDFFIVYLAAGAPFGIYYFFSNRFQTNREWRRLKSFLIFIFWIPFAVFLLYDHRYFKQSIRNFNNYSLSPVDQQDKIIFSIQKNFERIYAENEFEFSVFELREIFERYVGLTAALQSNEKITFPQEIEIFKINSTENVQLGALCLKRRNRNRLARHQNQARKDFLNLIEELSIPANNRQIIEQAASDLSVALGDLEARHSLEKIFARLPQTERRAGVQNLEKDLWKTDLPKPLPARKISSITALEATMNSSREG